VNWKLNICKHFLSLVNWIWCWWKSYPLPELGAGIYNHFLWNKHFHLMKKLSTAWTRTCVNTVCSRKYMAVARVLRPSVSNSKYMAKYGGRHTARSPHRPCTETWMAGHRSWKISPNQCLDLGSSAYRFCSGYAPVNKPIPGTSFLRAL